MTKQGKTYVDLGELFGTSREIYHASKLLWDFEYQCQHAVLRRPFFNCSAS